MCNGQMLWPLTRAETHCPATTRSDSAAGCRAWMYAGGKRAVPKDWTSALGLVLMRSHAVLATRILSLTPVYATTGDARRQPQVLNCALSRYGMISPPGLLTGTARGL